MDVPAWSLTQRSGLRAQHSYHFAISALYPIRLTFNVSEIWLILLALT